MWRLVMVVVVVAGLWAGCTQPAAPPTATPTPTPTSSAKPTSKGLVLLNWHCQRIRDTRGSPWVDMFQVSGSLRNDGNTLKDIEIYVQWLATDYVVIGEEEVSLIGGSILVPGEKANASLEFSLPFSDDYTFCAPRIISSGVSVDFIPHDRVVLPTRLKCFRISQEDSSQEKEDC